MPRKRERRDHRFRWSLRFAHDLSLDRQLRYEICFPTMELGIDIADLDLVNLRSGLPTPAYSAQRSDCTDRPGAG